MLIPTARRVPRGASAVGLVDLKVRIGNPADAKRTVELKMLLDSGAIYSVVPAAVLRRLGIEPMRKDTFSLADGRYVTRDLGGATFEIDGRRGVSTVIFGRRGDACLLGATTFEDLGLTLDPLKRQLRPLRLVLG
jgi:predicted aspartyl protease